MATVSVWGTLADSLVQGSQIASLYPTTWCPKLYYANFNYPFVSNWNKTNFSTCVKHRQNYKCAIFQGILLFPLLSMTGKLVNCFPGCVGTRCMYGVYLICSAHPWPLHCGVHGGVWRLKMWRGLEPQDWGWGRHCGPGKAAHLAETDPHLQNRSRYVQSQ